MNKNYGWCYNDTGEIDYDNQELVIHGRELLADDNLIYYANSEPFETNDLDESIQYTIESEVFPKQTKQKIKVELELEGSYGHKLKIFSAAKKVDDQIKYLKEIKYWLEQGGLASIVDDVINPYVTEWQMENGKIFFFRPEDYDNLLEQGLCINEEGEIESIEDVQSKDLINHIDNTSNPEGNQRKYLLDLIRK
jgi:hypothetical protein